MPPTIHLSKLPSQASWCDACLGFAISFIGLFAFAMAPVVADEPGSKQLAFFESKVRPLLIEHCLECHSSGAKIQGGLRLDSREGWAAGGDSGPAVIPGDLDGSLLLTAVRYHDSNLQMPPKQKLKADDIVVLEEWVRGGAVDPRVAPQHAEVKKQIGLSIEEGKKFWSFVPRSKPTPPTVANVEWPRNDIDRFVLAPIESKGIKVAADAPREALIRRAYYDLIGLPPTPSQIDTFLADGRPDAFARLVDELMMLPQFGERWGRHWLDVARFAESSGGGRTLFFKDAWRYRDYVINAFNVDMPFDQFITEQIAGDLLPYDSPEQRTRQLVATGFLALGPTNYEEQDKAALRMDIVDEQLDTLGKAFLGMTIGCARCHDHKFDPIPTRDYYAMAGIFRSTGTLRNYTDNVAHWLETPLPMDEEAEKQAGELDAKLAKLNGELKKVKAEAKRVLGDDSALVKSKNNAGAKSIPVASLPGTVVDDSQAKLIGSWKSSQSVSGFVGDGYIHDEDADKGTKTATFIPTITNDGIYEVRISYTTGTNRATNASVTVSYAEGDKTLEINQRERPAIDGRFVSLGQFRFEKSGAGYVVISNEGANGHVVADAVQLLPVGDSVASAPTAKDASKDAAKDTANVEVKQSASTENKTESTVDEAIAKRLNDEVKRIEGEVKTVTAQIARRPLAMSVRDEDVGDTEIRIRGVVKNLGPRVPRGFLQAAMTGPAPTIEKTESGRRQVAAWLADPAHPLTARVFANRAWNWLMGTGIVRTVDNLGVTGELPSHPELLDHLATYFVENGWSTKKLVREIMLSRTYQLATAPPVAEDPDNRLFSHANRRRLDAEQIRDSILFVSGELNRDIGGYNVNGGGAIDANTTAAQDIEYSYVFTDTRRSVYAPAFRNKRLELFEVFDFADINTTSGQRNVSTVAPQALYLMNHPFMLEQAKLAAERARTVELASDRARIEYAYRLALGRLPSETELSLAEGFLQTEGGDQQSRAEAWAQFYQSLFACIDFRYLN